MPVAGEHRPEPTVVHGLRLPGVFAPLAASAVVLAAGAFGAGCGLVVWLRAHGLHGLAWYTAIRETDQYGEHSCASLP